MRMVGQVLLPRITPRKGALRHLPSPHGIFVLVSPNGPGLPVQSLACGLQQLHEAAAEDGGLPISAQDQQHLPRRDRLRVQQEQAIPIFRRVAGYDPEIAQMHAGVEGGVFEAKARQRGRKLDMINLGCMTYDVHTPNERLEISSVGPLYEILREILKNVQ